MNDGTLFGLSQRQPPTAIPAEQGLLGSLLINNASFGKIEGFLQEEHFADPIHARIFRAIADRIRGGREVDYITLANEFQGSGILDAVGGVVYLAQLMTASPSHTLAREYAVAIADAWGRRRVIEAAQVAMDSAFGGMELADTMAVAAKAISEAERGVLGASRRRPVSILEAVDEAFDQADAVASGRAKPGIMIGMPAVDKVLGGLEPKNLMVLGGRPGMGKTALALKWAIAAARAGVVVGVISQEMPAVQLARRALGLLAGVSAEAIKRGQIDRQIDRLMKAREELADLPLFIEDGGRASIAEIGGVARSLAQKHGKLGLVIVDHLHIVRPTDADAKGGPTSAITGISHDAKDLAKALDAPLIMLAQLSRGVVGRDDHRPTIADLRQAGAIEEDADQVLFIHREEMFIPKDEPLRREGESVEKHFDRCNAWQEHKEKHAGKAQLLIEKNRGGESAVVPLTFVAHTTSFDDPSDTDQADLGWNA